VPFRRCLDYEKKISTLRSFTGPAHLAPLRAGELVENVSTTQDKDGNSKEPVVKLAKN
jgi:hypothetical protein